MNEQMTYHVAIQRKERVQHIINEIGMGQIIKEKYITSVTQLVVLLFQYL